MECHHNIYAGNFKENSDTSHLTHTNLQLLCTAQYGSVLQSQYKNRGESQEPQRSHFQSQLNLRKSKKNQIFKVKVLDQQLNVYTGVD